MCRKFGKKFIYLILQGSQISYNSYILEKCPILSYIFGFCPIFLIFLARFVSRLMHDVITGQADVERCFSINKQVLEDRILLIEHCLCGTRTLKYVIASHNHL